MPTPPPICILIVSRNNCADLVATLDNLEELDYPKEQLDLVLYDNGSTDATAEKVPAHLEGMSNAWGQLEYSRSEENLGAFGGRAVAQQQITERAQFVLSLDDDVEMAPDSLGILLEALQETGAGSVGARIVYHSDPSREAISAGYFSRWLGAFSGDAPDQRSRCHFTASCGTLYRRDVFESVGGFDVEYYTSHGDVDVCLKIMDAGYEVLYEPTAVIQHKVELGGTRNPERMYYLLRNKVLLFRKHLTLPQRMVVYTLYVLTWVPKLLLGSIVHHRGINWPEVKAIGQAVFDAVVDRRGRRRV